MWPPELGTVAAAVTGDRQAMATILTAGYPRLLAFYIGIGLARQEAEELVAEAAEGIVKGLPKLRSPQAFEAWFWTVARNRLRSLFRRRHSAQGFDAMISPATPEDWAVERDEHRRIWDALSQLSRKDRQLLWLREVEGLGYSEIATRLGSSAATIRVASHRARRRLEAVYLSRERV